MISIKLLTDVVNKTINIVLETNKTNNVQLLLFVYFQYSMNYRDFSAFNFKHDYFTNTDRVFFVIGQKQKIAPLKRGFHAAATKKINKNQTISRCDKS